MGEREIGLSEEGQARRRFLKQAGTVAWASPLIVTMMSRAASAQDPVVCGAIDPLDETVCIENAGACGTAQACVPSPVAGNLTRCVCATVPG